ncbi:MAG: hypothetical protein Ta2A_01070 [Treponemataceae bacterium]|nr:MAG: hypothetical protein Ta2A_01070 [Treponemataceae bacterium]
MKKRSFVFVGLLGAALALGITFTGCAEKCNVACKAQGVSGGSSRRSCGKSGCAVKKAEFSSEYIDVSCSC